MTFLDKESVLVVIIKNKFGHTHTHLSYFPLTQLLQYINSMLFVFVICNNVFKVRKLKKILRYSNERNGLNIDISKSNIHDIIRNFNPTYNRKRHKQYQITRYN